MKSDKGLVGRSAIVWGGEEDRQAGKTSGSESSERLIKLERSLVWIVGFLRGGLGGGRAKVVGLTKTLPS